MQYLQQIQNKPIVLLLYLIALFEAGSNLEKFWPRGNFNDEALHNPA